MIDKLNLGPLADGSGNLAALETVCVACGGSGHVGSSRERSVFYSGGSCGDCFGLGTIPTEDGKRLTAFLRRHSHS